MFAEKVKRLRRERGWSQDEFGEKIGVHGRHVGKYENGHTLPNAETIVKIANTLGVSIDYLLRDDADLYSAPNNVVQDPDLLKKFAAVEKMPPQDKQVVVSLIDAYIKKLRLDELIAS